MEHTTTAIQADHTYIFMKTENDSWKQLASVTAIGVPRSFQTEQIDVTHLASPGKSREYIGGRSPAPTIDVTIQYAPGDDTAALVYDARGETKDFRVVYPNEIMHSFSALVLNWDAGQATVGGLFEATLTLQQSGESTEGPAEPMGGI